MGRSWEKSVLLYGNPVERVGEVEGLGKWPNLQTREIHKPGRVCREHTVVTLSLRYMQCDSVLL